MNVPDKKRTVRSFVRRSGRMTSAQTRAIDHYFSQYGIAIDDKPLDLAAEFGRKAPLVLEIGYGNGESLVQLATEHPDMDFVGIEVHDPGLGHCLHTAKQAGISNLRVIAHDAIDVLQLIPDGTLSRINLYFPDPWPKKRHHKRRIVQGAFLNLCFRKLVEDGYLHIATDWANYAEHIDEVFAQSQSFAIEVRRVHDGDQPLERPTTKFEQRGLKKGHRIFDWKAKRV